MIKRLSQCIKEYQSDSILSALWVTLEVVMEVAIPLFMAEMIDLGIQAGKMNAVVKIGMILVGCTLLALGFGSLSGIFAARASSGFAKNVRKEMFDNIQNFSFSSLDKFSTASLVTRLTTDITNIQNAYQMIVRVLVRAPIMLAFALIMVIKVNAGLSLIFIGAVPFLGAGLYLIAMKAHPHFVKVFKRYDRLNKVVQENLTAVRVVKAYVREEHEIKKFHNVSGEVYFHFKVAEKILAFNNPIMQFSMYTCILLVAWFGAKMIVTQTMTTGQLMSLIIYAVQILFSLMILSMVFVMIVISKSSAERIVEVLNERSDLQSGDNPVYNMKDGSISFHDVDFSYTKDPEKLCLKQLNIEIKSGETVGILGGTGSGKTSLAQLIPRLYDVTSGSVKVGGIDVKNYDLDVLRNGVAMVLQTNVLFSGTIKANLRWGNKEASDEEFLRVCRLAQADGFIKGFPDKYDTIIEEGGTNLSGGQKQRLCIARALLKRPKILILDDSTSAVDTKTDALIRRAFREELPNTTQIIIAQRISSVQDADKIIVLDDGRINGIGTHAELLATNPIYREVYQSQSKGDSHDASEQIS